MKIIRIISIVSLLLSVFDCFALSERVIDEPDVVGTLYYTEGALEQPVIAIWGGSDGGNLIDDNKVFDLSVALFVKNGYAVLSLAYFDYKNSSTVIPSSLTRVPLEYFEKSFNWVQQQPELKKNTIAVYGLSRGGELALLLASKFEIIDLVIASVPSAYVWGSYDKNLSEEERAQLVRIDPCRAAWTWRGEDVPGICHVEVEKYEPWYDVIKNTSLVNDYLIPVEESSAAIFLSSGTLDRIWPSTDMSNLIISRLESRGYRYPFKHVSYHASHFVYYDSWQDVLEFIKLHYPAN